jgi:hypothetical protein
MSPRMSGLVLALVILNLMHLLLVCISMALKGAGHHHSRRAGASRILQRGSKKGGLCDRRGWGAFRLWRSQWVQPVVAFIH